MPHTAHWTSLLELLSVFVITLVTKRILVYLETTYFKLNKCLVQLPYYIAVLCHLL